MKCPLFIGQVLDKVKYFLDYLYSRAIHISLARKACLTPKLLKAQADRPCRPLRPKVKGFNLHIQDKQFPHLALNA